MAGSGSGRRKMKVHPGADRRKEIEYSCTETHVTCLSLAALGKWMRKRIRLVHCPRELEWNHGYLRL